MPPDQDQIHIHVDSLGGAASRLPASLRRISACFLPVRPSGYAGRETLQADLQAWRLRLQELKDFGVDTVILEAAADLDRDECYYQGSKFQSFTAYPFLEDFLHATAHEGVAVFVGGARASHANPSSDDLGSRLACFEDLAAHRQEFHGFYQEVPQAWFFAALTDPQALNTWLARLTRGMRDFAPEMPLLLMPPAPAPDGKPPSLQSLERVFAGSGVDILAPVSLAGSGSASLGNLEEVWAAWANLGAQLGISTWGTVDLHEPSPPSGSLVPADFRRLAIQLEAASHLEVTASGDITWWMTHHAGAAGLELRRQYMQNVDLGFVD